jgi:hypothetical protein
VKWNGNVPTLDKNSNLERDTSAWWNAEDPLNPKQVWRKKTLVEGKD